MNQQHSIEDTARKAATLRQLHAGPGLLVLPNAWDAASAKAVEAAGFPVVATTSAGVAAALGYGDHESAPREEMLAAAARIINAVSVPVTVDFEAGYNWSPQEVVEKLIGIGAVGMNIEDSNHNGGAKLVNAEGQAERLAAIKAAGRAAGVDLVLNARVDTFVSREGTSRSRSPKACAAPSSTKRPALTASTRSSWATRRRWRSSSKPSAQST